MNRIIFVSSVALLFVSCANKNQSLSDAKVGIPPRNDALVCQGANGNAIVVRPDYKGSQPTVEGTHMYLGNNNSDTSYFEIPFLKADGTDSVYRFATAKGTLFIKVDKALKNASVSSDMEFYLPLTCTK